MLLLFDVCDSRTVTVEKCESTMQLFWSGLDDFGFTGDVRMRISIQSYEVSANA